MAAILRHKREKQERREDHEVDRALHHVGSAARERDRADQERQRRSTRSLPPSPSWSGMSSNTDAAATAGIVSPMLASADPTARLRLVCSRSARAARIAARSPGAARAARWRCRSPPRARRPLRPRLRSPATASWPGPPRHTSETSSRPKLAHAAAADGGGAWTSSFALSAAAGSSRGAARSARIRTPPRARATRSRRTRAAPTV